MYVCIQKSTGKMVDSNSTCDKSLIKNAIGYGYEESDLEAKEISTAEWEALIAEANQPTPQEAAKKELSATDAGVARVAEDIFDALVAEGYAFPQEVMDKIAARKALRAALQG
jgi:hypothetical protein